MIWDELDKFEGLGPGGKLPDHLIFEDKQQFLEYCNNIWESKHNFSSYRAKYEREYLAGLPGSAWKKFVKEAETRQYTPEETLAWEKFAKQAEQESYIDRIWREINEGSK
tara:strand:- start:288 stop:617 length:330 start_codon:yes stop_codon:yes gene_type:complete